jgi:hypothetical protein
LGAAKRQAAEAEAKLSAVEAEIIAAQKQLVATVEEYTARTWRSVDVLLTQGGDPMLATTRAYWAVYNVSMSAAHLLDLDIKEYLEDCADAPRGRRIPHSKIAAVVSRIVLLIEPPRKIGQGQQSEASQKAFSLCRQLQKIRKRSDYMGFEQLSGERAQELITAAKDLATRIWRYTLDNHRN